MAKAPNKPRGPTHSSGYLGLRLEEPYNFSWVVPNRLCASSCPSVMEEINWLKKEGVKVIISLSDDFQPPPLARRDMECHLISVVEFHPPMMDDIKRFMEICHKAASENKAVCVHCRMGMGRTGVMVACYLMKHFNLDAQLAIDSVRHIRPYSIETASQERSVKEFEKCISTE